MKIKFIINSNSYLDLGSQRYLLIDKNPVPSQEMMSIQQILHKIRQICESCYQDSNQQIKVPRNYKNVMSSTALQKPRQISQTIIKQYLLSLQHLHQYLTELKQFKIQYQSLQQCLQKQQTEIRKHIGIEQQLRIYTDGIKLQLQQCQKERFQLLENSKFTIKNLKLKNQKLFEEVTSLKKKNQFYQKLDQKTFQNSRIKTKIKQKSRSGSGQRADSSLKKIIKTQYIERQKHPFVNPNVKKQLKYKNEGLQMVDKKHKHHKSTFVTQNARNSQSKKKYRMDFPDKVKKQKTQHSNNKHYDLGAYLSKHDLKKSPFKTVEKVQHKTQVQKKNEKHNKSTINDQKQKNRSKTNKKQCQQLREQKLFTKQEYQLQNRKYLVHENRKQQKKEKSKSKQSKKRLKTKDQIKKELPKKTFQHNRSLFSVSSMQYRTQIAKQKQKGM